MLIVTIATLGREGRRQRAQPPGKVTTPPPGERIGGLPLYDVMYFLLIILRRRSLLQI